MARFLPALPRPVLPAERYHVAPRIGPTRAEKAMLAESCDGTFRPPDAATHAKIEEAFALFVPFWRVRVTASASGCIRGGGRASRASCTR